MKKLLSLILICLSISSLFSFGQASSPQTDTLKYYWGPYLGYNLNVHSANFRTLNPDCPTCLPDAYGTNTTGGLGFGGLFEYLIYQDGKQTPMRIGLRVGYSDIGGKIVAEENSGNQPPEGNTNHISEHNLDFSLSTLNFAPYFSYSVIDKLVLNAGLNIGLLMSKKFDQ